MSRDVSHVSKRLEDRRDVYGDPEKSLVASLVAAMSHRPEELYSA